VTQSLNHPHFSSFFVATKIPYWFATTPAASYHIDTAISTDADALLLSHNDMFVPSLLCTTFLLPLLHSSP
jgi:hypothetical protein